MRVQTVLLTRRCNQGCSFCDRVAPNSIDPTQLAVTEAIDRAAQAGAGEIVLTGGEPLLRGDLLALVRAAAAGGRRVVLETNATLLRSADHARALREAGVALARVSIVTTNPDLHRTLVGGATSPRHVFRGISWLLEAGLPVEIRLPLAVGLAPAAARLAGVARALPAAKRFTLAAVGAGVAPAQALPPHELAEQLTEAFREASRADVDVTLAADHPVAPCGVALEGQARRLFEGQLGNESSTPNAAHEACARCALAPRCRLSAADLSRALGQTAPTPIADATPFVRPGKNPGTRLRVLREADVETFFHVDYEFGAEVDIPTSRVGIIYRCNQVCTFCELADMSVDLTPEKVRAAIDAARARGSVRLIVTGGEPTLSPHLVDHVRHARSIGFEQIELQTNAVLLDRPGFAERLREAGLTSAQISLHGPDPTVSDRLTAAPGTHARTLVGVSNLLRVGVNCLLNHLIFVDNCHLLEAFVDMVEARWGAFRKQIVVQFHSPRNEFPDRASALRHVPRYSDYAAGLLRAIDRARSLGFRVHDLQDPTGIPSLCVLGADEAYLGPIAAQAARPRVHAWESPWLARVEACSSCDLATSCIGVPRHYLALHGDAEFRPIRLPPAHATAPSSAPHEAPPPPDTRPLPDAQPARAT